MNYNGFAVRCKGASHIRNHTVCQDSAKHIQDEKAVVSAVADGHGSSAYFRSDRGSEFAVEIGCEKLFDFLHTTDLSALSEQEQFEKITELTNCIVNGWRTAIMKDLLELPFTEDEMLNVPEKDKENSFPFSESQRDAVSREELEQHFDAENPSPEILSLFKAYGSTLICLGFCENFGLGLHVGDGKCVAVYPDGTTDEPIPWDEKCHLNRCTSLCDERAKEEFRHHIWKDMFPTAVFSASDGIDDTFADRLHWFYLQIALEFMETDFEKCVSEIEAQLPKFSERGSQDDMSLCGIIDIEQLRTMTEMIHETIQNMEREQKLTEIQQKLLELEYRKKSVEKIISLSSDEPKIASSREKLAMLEEEIRKIEEQRNLLELKTPENSEPIQETEFEEDEEFEITVYEEIADSEEFQFFEESEAFEHFEKSPELVTEEDGFED